MTELEPDEALSEVAEMLARLPRRYEADVTWDRLHPHPMNPRKGDVGLIMQSIKANGWWGVVIAQESTGHILIGNHRSLAAQRLGFPVCPDVQWVTCDDEQALRILAMDNRSADMAFYEDAQLAAVLSKFAESEEGFTGTGFDQGAYDLLMANLNADDTRGDVGSSPTPGDRSDDYAATDIRSVILPFAGSDFDIVLDKLSTLRGLWGYDTNAQVIYHLVTEAAD